MQFKSLTPDLSVGPQIGDADLPAIAQAGFKSLICNRPDGETFGQPAFAALQASAQRLGLVCRYLPVETGKVTAEQGGAFGLLMEELPKPVLAYCRSGLRSSTLWSLSRPLDALESPQAPTGAHNPPRTT